MTPPPPPGDSKEDLYAEQPALQWLGELGWEIGHGPELSPDGGAPEREHWRDVVLIGRLRAAVAALNPELPEDAVEHVVQQVLATSSPNVAEDHADFHRLLVDRVPVVYADDEGVERSARAKLVDFDDPEQNDYLAVNQFTVIDGTKNRRPDILLFVNGLPLGQVELKNPADEKATPESAANQVAHYADTIPPLYRFVEIIGVSDLIQARVGTITTPAEHFAEWKTMDPDESKGKSELEVMLRGVFAPARLLDLVRNFVLFEVDAGKTTKIMAKYHQVDAVNRAVEATAEAMGADGRAGVVWHTQGSGKSYSMVFYVSKLRRDPRFENPTVVAVTDRTDLDDQLHETFAKQSELAQAVKVERAESVAAKPARAAQGARRRDRLHDDPEVRPPNRIRRDAGPLGAAERDRDRRRGAPVAVRELRSEPAHGAAERDPDRLHGHADRDGPLDAARLRRLHLGLPDGAARSRTARPSRSTTRAGDAARDRRRGSARRGRGGPRGEEDEELSELVSAWAKLERVVGSRERLEQGRRRHRRALPRAAPTLPGKAMVVGMSRRICAELTELLKAELGGEAVTCVISASATDDPAISKWRRSTEERKQVEADFKDPEHPLRVVVVRDMWLTGFDVPPRCTRSTSTSRCATTACCRRSRASTASSATSRAAWSSTTSASATTSKALPRYAAKDVEDAMVPVRQVLSKLREKHEVLCEFLHGLEWRDRQELDPAARATLLVQAHAMVVEDDDQTKRFLDEQSAFARLLALVNPDPAVEEFLGNAEFFAEIAASVRKYTPPEGEPSEAARQAVKQVFSEGLGAGEITDVLGLSGDERPEVSILSDEFLDDLQKKMAEPSLAVAFLKKLLNDEIRSRGRRNQMQAKLFGDELDAVLARYRNRQITGAEVVKALVELAKKVRDASHRHEELGLSEEEAAFYDALVGSAEDLAADPTIADIARDLVRGIRADLSVDWTSHESREALIRRKIKRLLRKHNYRPPVSKGGNGTAGGGRMTLERATRLILDQARVLYYRWPEVDPEVSGL